MPSLEKTSDVYANRLYRNDGSMRFTDVTEAAGVRGVGYAMGAAAADYDNDGDIDLFVAGVRQQPAAAQSRRWPIRRCDETGRHRQRRVGGRRRLVRLRQRRSPRSFRRELRAVVARDQPVVRRRGARHSDLLPSAGHSRGFRIVSIATAGTAPSRMSRPKQACSAHIGKGMSVAFADYDHDGRLDIFVTNDTVPNFLFHNKGDGTFAEEALLAGVSVPARAGRFRAWARISQDYDNDGWPDIHITALAGETFPLFRNDGHGAFIEDDAVERSRQADGQVVRLVLRFSLTWTTTAGRTSSPRTRTSTTASATVSPSHWQAGEQPVPQRWARALHATPRALRTRRLPSPLIAVRRCGFRR